jgi:hypothetical protein
MVENIHPTTSGEEKPEVDRKSKMDGVHLPPVRAEHRVDVLQQDYVVSRKILERNESIR